MILRCLVLLLVSGLAACGASRHCERAQPYQDATSLPALQPVEGAAPPSSPSALRIPDAPAEPIAFAATEPDPRRPERTRTRCLDLPPPLPARHLVIPDEE